jgi:hypothetical protein
MDDSRETRDQLIAAAAAAGYVISSSQLGRLYRAGLVAKPSTRALGRGLGSESRYPPGTAARLVRVLEVRAKEHRLSDTAWRLWWEDGGSMPPAVRVLLTGRARSLDNDRQRLAALLDGDLAGEPDAVAEIDQLYRDAEDGRVSGPLGAARRNVGRERFAAVARVLVEVAAGSFTAGEGESSELLGRALGLTRTPTDRLAEASFSLTDGLDGDLAVISGMLRSLNLCELASSDEIALDAARFEIRSLIAVVTTITPLLERLHGRGASGFGLISRAFGRRDAHSEVLMLLVWLAARTNQTLRSGLETITALAPQAAATIALDGLISDLRREVSVLAPVLSDERLAAAQRDERAARDLNADIAALRERHMDAFDAFFAAHPETQRLIAVIDTHRDAVGNEAHSVSGS